MISSHIYGWCVESPVTYLERGYESSDTGSHFSNERTKAAVFVSFFCPGEYLVSWQAPSLL